MVRDLKADYKFEISSSWLKFIGVDFITSKSSDLFSNKRIKIEDKKPENNKIDSLHFINKSDYDKRKSVHRFIDKKSNVKFMYLLFTGLFKGVIKTIKIAYPLELYLNEVGKKFNFKFKKGTYYKLNLIVDYYAGKVERGYMLFYESIKKISKKFNDENQAYFYLKSDFLKIDIPFDQKINHKSYSRIAVRLTTYKKNDFILYLREKDIMRYFDYPYKDDHILRKSSVLKMRKDKNIYKKLIPFVRNKNLKKSNNFDLNIFFDET